jgi:hypothetical protein
MMMGCIDITWPMLGAISLTLGLVHLLVWMRRPAQYAYLLFFVSTVRRRASSGRPDASCWISICRA